MRRRSVLSSVGLVAATLAGCLDTGAPGPSTETTGGLETTPETATPTATTASVDPSEHDVAVTRTVEHGATGLTSVLRVTDGGDLSSELVCPDGSTESVTAMVSGDEWAAFERRVLSAAIPELSEQYDCETGCPSDAPPTRLTFDVDGHVTEVVVEAGADRPPVLADLLDTLAAWANRLDGPTCE